MHITEGAAFTKDDFLLFNPGVSNFYIKLTKRNPYLNGEGKKRQRLRNHCQTRRRSLRASLQSEKKGGRVNLRYEKDQDRHHEVKRQNKCLK